MSYQEKTRLKDKTVQPLLFRVFGALHANLSVRERATVKAIFADAVQASVVSRAARQKATKKVQVLPAWRWLRPCAAQ